LGFKNPILYVPLIHFHAHVSCGEGRGSSSPLINAGKPNIDRTRKRVGS